MKNQKFELGYYGFDGVFHVKCSGSKYNVNKKYMEQKPLKKGRKWEIIKV